MSVWSIVVAGGSGSRFGRPKQFEALAGRRLLEWAVEAAAAASDGVVLVAPADRVGALTAGEAGATGGCAPIRAVVAGGRTRASSVRAGLRAVPPEAEIVVVHDAARPLAGAALFRAVVEAVRRGADAALPGIPVTDTIRHRDGGVVDRDQLVAVQTPQAFRAESLRRAHVGEPEATDDVALVERAGGRVAVVPGSPANLKVTDPDDLAIAEALLRRHGGQLA